jgi:hypothetical protein
MASDEEKSVKEKGNGDGLTPSIDEHQAKASGYQTYAIRFYGLALICILNIVSSINWLSVAPVPDHANAFFNNVGLTTINWFSNIFLLIYIVAGPLSSYVFYRHSIKTGVSMPFILRRWPTRFLHF